MAKMFLEVDGKVIEPELVLKPPTAPFINKPSREELREHILGFTPQEWDEGDVTIYTDHGQLGIFHDDAFGYILVALKPDEEPDYLMDHQPNPSTRLTAIHNGRVYYVKDNFFVDFDKLWQAITYYLDHKDIDPSLLWTKGEEEG